jgi:signal transduction histidine kinase
MKHRLWPESPGFAVCLAVAIGVAVATLSWLALRTTREWHRSSMLLVERRADEAARLLATALMRDMRAAQENFLSWSTWEESTLESPDDPTRLVASAFARYPYPETFMTWRPERHAEGVTFFTRSDRPPPWAEVIQEPHVYPVRRFADAAVGRAILKRIQQDVARHRRMSVFEMDVAGVRYQIVANLHYRDQFRQEHDGVFGFMVNLPWVRQHYFSALTREVARIHGEDSGLSFAIVDEQNETVVSTRAIGAEGPTIRRAFPLMFFDSTMVAVNPPASFYQRNWTVVVSGDADPTLAMAIRSSNRTLAMTAVATAILAIGLILAVRSVRASAKLADIRGEFVSSVTHELKTPIATIRAVGDTLAAGRIATPGMQRQFAGLVVQEAKRLARLVDNLLALARITDIAEVYSFEPLDLTLLVSNAVKGFSQQLATVQVTPQVIMTEDLPPIRADRMAVELVLDNLIDNAIRYSREIKTLRIVGRREGPMVALDVVDEGRGIPEDEIDMVTQKFFRGRNAGTGGSGLGLAIVQRIVRDHHGSLAIRSVVDQGTTITVMLPAAKPIEEAVGRSRRKASDHGLDGLPGRLPEVEG